MFRNKFTINGRFNSLTAIILYEFYMKAKRRVSAYVAFNSRYKRTRTNCFHRIIEDQGNSADSLSRLRALTTPLAQPLSSIFVFVILGGNGLYDATHSN